MFENSAASRSVISYHCSSFFPFLKHGFVFITTQTPTLNFIIRPGMGSCSSLPQEPPTSSSASPSSHCSTALNPITRLRNCRRRRWYHGYNSYQDCLEATRIRRADSNLRREPARASMAKRRKDWNAYREQCRRGRAEAGREGS
ncbi:MAG: hypothetical protein LQ348_003390 [Seirophora lacunosa]|nr:MAG: hypothetical protein LQ348_003390 [Seirophora lacunosa]